MVQPDGVPRAVITPSRLGRCLWYARRNPAGVAKNLRGARERLADGAAAGPDAAVDVMGLLADVDDRLAADRIDAQPPPVIRRSPR